jgi:hypothetical protein
MCLHLVSGVRLYLKSKLSYCYVALRTVYMRIKCLYFLFSLPIDAELFMMVQIIPLYIRFCAISL